MTITIFGHIALTPADWIDWKNNPVTQEIFNALRRERDDWATQLIEGRTLALTGREIIETAKAVGIVYGIDCLLEGIEETLKNQWRQIEEEREETEYGGVGNGVGGGVGHGGY